MVGCCVVVLLFTYFELQRTSRRDFLASFPHVVLLGFEYPFFF